MQKPVISRWLVGLTGASHDLDELELAIGFPVVTVARSNGVYYLESNTLNPIEDPSEVLNAAKRLTEMVNGVARLHFDHWGNVEVSNSIVGIDEQGHAHKFAFGFGTGRPVNESYADSAIIERWLATAVREERVANAIRFFSTPTWTNLYKIFEIVRDDVGDVVAQGWAAKRELARFTQTAQTPESIGDAARHASKKFKPHAEPMSHTEATSFIKDLLRRWLGHIA
ncbi:MAG: hypothetical protein NTZ17_11800 [Phycisphaerae bacterium]|nr:hypothetical protein [Phycisphaerae bacterium]